jgi:hypothetical protein
MQSSKVIEHLARFVEIDIHVYREITFQVSQQLLFCEQVSLSVCNNGRRLSSIETLTDRLCVLSY